MSATFTPVNPALGTRGFFGEMLRPLALPGNPIPKPKTPAGKQALELHKAAQEAAKRIQEARDAEIEAVGNLADAKERLRAEIVRGGREGRNLDAERELSAEVARLELLAAPSVVTERKSAAAAVNNETITAYQRFVTENVGDLIAELVPEAEKVSADLVDIIEKVTPIEAAYKEVHERIRQLVILAGLVADERWNLAQAPAPPLPSRELWDSTYTPEPAPEVKPPRRMTMDRQTGEFVVEFNFPESAE